MELESSVQKICRRLIKNEVVNSAHDCSDGGLAVTLAECCISSGLGFHMDSPWTGRWDAVFFGENQSRIVVSMAPGKLRDLESICDSEGVPWVMIGRVGGSSLRIGDLVDLEVAEMQDAWENALEKAVKHQTP